MYHRFERIYPSSGQLDCCHCQSFHHCRFHGVLFQMPSLMEPCNSITSVMQACEDMRLAVTYILWIVMEMFMWLWWRVRPNLPRSGSSVSQVAVQLDSVIRREPEVSLLSSTYRSDSQIVLAYITNETRRFKTFVANRVANIRGHSWPSQW